MGSLAPSIRIWPCPASSVLLALSTSAASVLPARLLRLLRCFPHKYSLTDPALRSLPYAEALHAASGSHDITARPAPTGVRYPPCLPLKPPPLQPSGVLGRLTLHAPSHVLQRC